jgi:hypothetical protein
MIRKQVTAIAIAGSVVFAAFIGMPQIDQRSLNQTAQTGQHLAIDLDQLLRTSGSWGGGEEASGAAVLRIKALWRLCVVARYRLVG